MGEIFGYKRWYEIEREKKGKKFKSKAKIKREYENQREYVLKINEISNDDVKESINNNDFIEQLIKYKTDSNFIGKFNKKFHMGNILFKLKGKEKIRQIKYYSDFLETEEVIRKVEVLAQTKRLAEKVGITRKDIEDKINNPEITEQKQEEEVKGIKIKIDKEEKFDKEQNREAIKINILSDEELKIKRDIYDEFKSINANLYNVVKATLNKGSETKRYYEEYIRKHLIKEGNEKISQKFEITYFEKIIKSLGNISEKIKNISEINIKGFINYYSNINTDKTISENKKHFIDKINRYFESNMEIVEEDIIDFLMGELKYFDIIKRVEEKSKQAKQSKEKIYIILDKHEKFKNKEYSDKKNRIVKEIVENLKSGNLKNDIEEIFKDFRVKDLIRDLKDSEKGLDFDNIDTEIFGIYKKHYRKYEDKEKFSNMSDYEKELYKITYRYIKGRIEKILVNREKVKENKDDKWTIDKILDEKILIEKIEKRVKQYALEHIMYLGKIVHNLEETPIHKNIKEEDVNTKKFTELHGQEELDLELITFFSVMDMELNKLFEQNGKSQTDFFGDGKGNVDFEIKENLLFSKQKLLENLNFMNDENKGKITNVNKDSIFHKFLERSYLLRNDILHGKMERNRNSKELQSEYKNIKIILENLKVSDEEISKSLNLDIVFEGKKYLIDKINNIQIDEDERKRYLPSFSKILPKIRLKLKEQNLAKDFEDEIGKLILNAAIYVNKILYQKTISNNEFLNSLTKKINEKLKNGERQEVSIENFYKEAQVSASKGNKKAVSKYQKKIVDFYIEYIEKNYKDIFDFSNINDKYDEIREKIEKNRKEKQKPKIILNDDKIDIKIDYDFEYIISVFALLSDNICINKIRNRFFATSVWLKDDNKYGNIIYILDKIISINSLREDNITGIWKYDLEGEIIKVKEYEDLLSNNNNIFNNERYYKELKHEIRENFKSEKEFYKVLSEKYREVVYFSNGKYFNFKKIEDDIDKKKISEYAKKLNGIIPKFFKDKENEISKKIILNSLFLYGYKQKIDDLISSNTKLKDIYCQKEKKNNENTKKEKRLYIYKKNLFNDISNSNFDKTFELFKEDLENVNPNIKNENDENITEIIRKEKIFEVDRILKSMNEYTKGYSQNYKNKLLERIKDNSDEFKKITSLNYNNCKEFLKVYNQVSEYKRMRDLVEFNYFNKINNYLIEINWKLAIQMARFERDMHYIVRGLEKLKLIKLETARNEGRSAAYPKYNKGEINFNTTFYVFGKDDIEKENSYKEFENICLKFEIDLRENSMLQSKEEENIRNYISHFYIVREPFKNYSIAEQIDKVAELLSYRAKYNNSTYNSIFEVFKKDVKLNYINLKEKFRLTEDKEDKSKNKTKIFKIEELIEPKEVSTLKLKHYNSEYLIGIIKELLAKKN